ncbi:MAG: DUF2721 domain-containing protein [Sediminibacterium sp.]
MDISINTPALLFPAISLVLLAYTNRYLALASRIRSLHDKYLEKGVNDQVLHGQIKNIRYRLKLIKNMQMLGMMSIITSICSIFLIYIDQTAIAHMLFAFSLLAFMISLGISLLEISLSNKALELELSDMEGLEDPTVMEYLKKKFE